MVEMSDDERLQLTRGILGMLESWGISDSNQVAILGLTDKPAREVRRMRDGKALPNDPEVMARVEHLIAIADALRTTYPFSKRMGELWMHKPNRKFRKRSPIAIMVEDGMMGMVSVRSYLDCSYSWDLSGSRA